MNVIGGYEDYTAGKGHGVPAQHCTRVLVTDGAGYYNMPLEISNTLCDFYIVRSCPIRPIVGIMGIDAKGKRGLILMFQRTKRVANYHHSHDTVSFSFFACTRVLDRSK